MAPPRGSPLGSHWTSPRALLGGGEPAGPSRPVRRSAPGSRVARRQPHPRLTDTSGLTRSAPQSRPASPSPCAPARPGLTPHPRHTIGARLGGGWATTTTRLVFRTAHLAHRCDPTSWSDPLAGRLSSSSETASSPAQGPILSWPPGTPGCPATASAPVVSRRRRSWPPSTPRLPASTTPGGRTSSTSTA